MRLTKISRFSNFSKLKGRGKVFVIYSWCWNSKITYCISFSSKYIRTILEVLPSAWSYHLVSRNRNHSSTYNKNEHSFALFWMKMASNDQLCILINKNVIYHMMSINRALCTEKIKVITQIVYLLWWNMWISDNYKTYLIMWVVLAQNEDFRRGHIDATTWSWSSRYIYTIK